MTMHDEPIDGGTAVEAVFQTVLCGNHTTVPLATQDRLRLSMQALFGHALFMAGGGSLEASQWYPHTHEFISTSLNTAVGRKWCATDWSCFGIVPGGAKNGDHIVMLDNCPLPFVLRSRSEGEDTEYSLIGHGYFHDLKKRVDSFNDTLKYREVVIA